NSGHDGAPPAMTGGARRSFNHQKQPDPKREIRAAAVKESFVQILEAWHHAVQHSQTAQHQQQPLQMALLNVFRAVHRRNRQNEPAPDDTRDPQCQEYMWWAEDFYIESIRVVPPVIERRGGDHRQTAPRRNKRSQRAAEAEHSDGILAQLRIRTKRGAENGPATNRRSNHSAELNKHMGRRPERIAPNAHMPGDVPIKTDRDRSRGQRAGPYCPRYAGRNGFLACRGGERAHSGIHASVSLSEWSVRSAIQDTLNGRSVVQVSRLSPLRAATPRAGSEQ